MAELYELIRVPVYSYALSLVKSPQDAEDILHDTLISVHNAAHSYRPASGDGPKAHFTTKRDNCVVKFTFRYMDNKVTAEVVE